MFNLRSKLHLSKGVKRDLDGGWGSMSYIMNLGGWVIMILVCN